MLQPYSNTIDTFRTKTLVPRFKYATIGSMNSATVSSQPSRVAALLIVALFTVVWALFIHSRAYSSNDASRLASIESLVQRGTWAIDESPFATIDRIKLGDHFYSDKPPILSWAGAGVYALLHHGFGLTLQPWGCAPERTSTWCRALFEANEADWAYFILTLLLVASPGTLILVLIYRLARRNGRANGSGLWFVIVLGLGTAIFPYSTVFNNHLPAAAATLVAVYGLITTEVPSRIRLIVVGLAAALAAAIDLSCGIFTIALFFYVVARYRSKSLWFAAGALVPIAITIILDYQIIGSPVLPYMVPQGYAYAGSELNATLAGTRRADDVPRYAFDLLFGDRGVIMFYPIVLWYLVGAVHAARSGEVTTRWLARLMLSSSLFYTLYFVLFTDTFGGYSFSPRWLLNLMPLMALFSVIDRSARRSTWRVALIGGVAAYSIAQAYAGALNPWSPALPILRLEYTAPQPLTQPNVAMSGYSSFNDVPNDVRKTLGANNIVPRKFDAKRGLVIFNGPGWWFIDQSTPLAPELAGPLGLGVTTTFALNANLTPALNRWLTSFETVGQPEFNGEIKLLGVQQTQRANELSVITVWTITSQPQPVDQRRIVLELVASDGSIVQNNEALAARYTSLQIGDVLVQVQKLPLTALTAGQYQLQLGVLNPDTGERLKLPGGAERLRVMEISK